MHKFLISEGYSSLVGRDGYIEAYENSSSIIPENFEDFEDFEIWLEELGSENYRIIDEYLNDYDTHCRIYIEICDKEYAMAFKLRWC